MLEPSETDSVGYKKPPRKAQFKPGVSGNPSGRPAKPKLDMGKSLNKALNDKIVVTGTGKTLTGLEGLVQSVVDRLLKGDSKAITEFMRFCTRAKLFKVVADPTRLSGVQVSKKYFRDRCLGKLGGWYPLGEDGLGIWIDPITKEQSERPPNAKH